MLIRFSDHFHFNIARIDLQNPMDMMASGNQELQPSLKPD